MSPSSSSIAGSLWLCVTLAAVSARADALPSASAVPEKPGARLSVDPRSSRSDLSLYVVRGVAPLLGPGGQTFDGSFEPLCRAPCTFKPPHGPRVYGVAAGDRPAVRLDRELALRPGDALSVRYRSRSLARLTGWIVLLGGAGASSALLGLGSGRDSTALTVTGGALSGVSVALGLVLASLPDRASGVVLPR